MTIILGVCGYWYFAESFKISTTLLVICFWNFSCKNMFLLHNSLANICSKSAQFVVSTLLPRFSGVDLITCFRVYMYILENLSLIYTINVCQHLNASGCTFIVCCIDFLLYRYFLSRNYFSAICIFMMYF